MRMDEYNPLKINIQNLLMILLLSVLFTGCAITIPTIHNSIRETETLNLPIKSPTMRPTRQIANTPIPFITSTSTPEFITPSEIPSESKLTIECLELSDQPLASVELPWNILISTGTKGNGVGLFNPNTNEITELSMGDNTSSNWAFVSPNSNWIVFTGDIDSDNHPDSFTLMNANGKQISTRSWPKNWRNIQKWFDNEWVMIQISRNGQLFSLYSILYNPFTGEVKELPKTYPNKIDPYPVYHEWQEFGGSLLVYDPTLTKVVYPTYENGFVIWDQLQSKPLAEVPIGTGDYSFAPVWINNGTAFILDLVPQSDIRNHNLSNFHETELFSVNLSGELTRLTNLVRYYKEVDFHISRLSNNGKMLALLVNTGRVVDPITYENLGSSDFRLFTYNIETQSVKNFCLPGTALGSMIWSPDDNYLIYEIESVEGLPMYVILDFMNKVAIPLPIGDFIPINWILSD